MQMAYMDVPAAGRANAPQMEAPELFSTRLIEALDHR